MSKRVVLLIEDDADLRETSKEFLADEGFEAITAENGPQGIQLAIQHNPDVIVCDINMPGLSGYEVYNMLHQINSTAVIPFIFLTAKSSREEILTGLHLGADDYITKPFEFSHLINVINLRIQQRAKLIEQQDEKFNILFKNINAGACIIRNNEFLFANPHLCKLLSYSSEEISDLSFTNIIHRDSLSDVTLAMNQCNEGVKKAFLLNIKALTKSQEPLPLELKGSLISFKGESCIICTFNEAETSTVVPTKSHKRISVKLSEREVEILRLICQGLSNLEISEKLFISERTVEGHRSRLFAKTDSKNAVALAMWAVKNGYVEP